jgi:hypothetical protein
MWGLMWSLFLIGTSILRLFMVIGTLNTQKTCVRRGLDHVVHKISSNCSRFNSEYDYWKGCYICDRLKNIFALHPCD